jgi:hypothetical protein
MHTRIRGRLLLFSAPLALAACVSTNSGNSGPPSPDTAQTNLAIISHAAATSDASLTPGLKPGNGYRKLTKNGEEYYCRKVLETGSRTKSQVTCLTRDELTALSQNGQDLLNGIRSVPGSQGSVDARGGMQNSAVSGQ